MDADPVKPLPAFGFLTVLDSAEHGFFGGYLVLSPLGRPLEFRCSTPIAPSRAQQILYGPTLRPYLFAEVIGQALVAGSEMPVRVILTDQRDMLPLCHIRSECIAYVERVAGTAAAPAPEVREIAGCSVTMAELASVGMDQLRGWLEPLAARVDLCEPFDRIIAALTEAQMASHDAADGPDDHAAAA
jgi:hypothetical protein